MSSLVIKEFDLEHISMFDVREDLRHEFDSFIALLKNDELVGSVFTIMDGDNVLCFCGTAPFGSEHISGVWCMLSRHVNMSNRKLLFAEMSGLIEKNCKKVVVSFFKHKIGRITARMLGMEKIKETSEGELWGKDNHGN